MAELRIHDQSSIYFKSIRTGTTTKDIDVKIPDKSGTLITDTTLQDILNRGGRFSASQILKPDITETPLEHPEAYSKLLPIASYRTSDTFVGEHTATEWVASEQPDFSIILDSTSDSLFRDGWYPAVNRPSVPVYVKYRFISEDVCSPYSDALEFTTPTGGVKIPTLSVAEDGVTPTVKGSTFALYGDATGINHVSSSWEVYRVRDNKLIKSITQDSSKLTEYKIEAGLLDSDTEYKFVLTYHTDHPVFSRTRKALGIYKTPESSIKTPTLSFSSDNNKYLIIGTPFVVNSGTDEHKFTAWEVKNATDAVVYTEPNSRDLTTLNLTGVLEPDSSYTVSAVYKGAKASSAKAVLTFRTPVETIDNLNKKITLTRLSDGGVELKMDKVQLATAEKLLYLTWTVQNYEKKVALEVRLDKDLDTKYGQDLIYTMTPAESWLKWFPNLDAVNPTIKLSAKGRVVGEKTILNYSTSAPFEYKPKIELGEMSVAGHTESLTPLVSITAHSGEDLSWITVTNATWELWKLQEGLNPVKVKSVDSNDLLKNRYNGLDYNTNYRATVVYNTNFGKYSKSIEFKSADIFLPRPNVIVESKGNTILIKVNNPDRNIPGKPEKSHGSTTWILYSNTGDTLWKSEKNTTNLTEITLPTGLLQGTTNYKVGVIFHSRDGLLNSNEGQASYYHRGIEIQRGYIESALGINAAVKAINQNYTLKDFEVYEGGVKSTTESIVSGKIEFYWGSQYAVRKIGYYTIKEDAYYQESESIVNSATYYTVPHNVVQSGVKSITLRTNSGLEKTYTDLGRYGLPSPYGRYKYSAYVNNAYNAGVGRLMELSDSPTGNDFKAYNTYIYFKGEQVPKYTHTTTTTIDTNWENGKVVKYNLYAPINFNYLPMISIGGIAGDTNYNKNRFLTINPVSITHGSDSFILYGYIHNSTVQNPQTISNVYNDAAKRSYGYLVNNVSLTSNDVVEEMLKSTGLVYFNRAYTNGNDFFINSSIGNKNPSIDIIQFSPATLIYNDTTRKFINAAMIGPNTYEYCYVSTDIAITRNNVTNTYFFKYELDNLDKYFHYFNNIVGLDYPVNGMPYNVRFSTIEEVKMFFSSGVTGSSDSSYNIFITNIFNANANIYYQQDNASLTGNVSALKPVKIDNRIGFTKVNVSIHDCIFLYTVTPRDPHTTNIYDNSLITYTISCFKKLYPNVVQKENINPSDYNFGSVLNFPKVDELGDILPNTKYWAKSLLNINSKDITYGTIKNLYYSWLSCSGYIRTIPANEFKSLSQIRTMLGLSPTNALINESDLTEWYMLYWRGRIFYVPNIPIATTDENVLDRWKVLYTIPGKNTVEPIAIDKKSDKNLYKLTIPEYTDITDFKSLTFLEKLRNTKMNKYAKPGRIAPIGYELGDMLNPDIIDNSYSYPAEISNKLKAVYAKLTSNTILPFFELLPANVTYRSGNKIGLIVFYLEEYNNKKKLRIKIMLGNDSVESLYAYKIDKVIIKLTSAHIKTHEKIITADNITYTQARPAASGKLNMYIGIGNSIYTTYEGVIEKDMPSSDYPEVIPSDGINDLKDFTSFAEIYIHMSEPADSFIYLYQLPLQFVNHNGKILSGGVIRFSNIDKVERTAEITYPTLETDVTKRYCGINEAKPNAIERYYGGENYGIDALRLDTNVLYDKNALQKFNHLL
nr:MAG TPA: hypothetical protein [Caudoviricetes sp.]